MECSKSSMIAKIAILSALSFALYMFPKFPLPFFPFFLELNFSDVPALLGGFILGPIAGAVIVCVKVLLKLPFSSTVYVGELTDLFIGLAFVLPPAIIYKRKRTLKGALIGLIIGAAVSTAAAIISNIYVSIPCYVKLLFKGDITPIVEACKLLIPGITAENFFLPYSLGIVLPFNIVRCAVGGGITFLLYKRISKLFCKF